MLPAASQPNLGLVCITLSNEIHYRTITRKRLLSLETSAQESALTNLYVGNAATLRHALHYCRAADIRLYRISSQIFPFADEPLGIDVLSRFANELGEIGDLATRHAIRLVIHPDQFVVLNSDSAQVVSNSIKIMTMHAATLDYLKQPLSPWSVLELHGGKGQRAAELIAAVADLPPNIRTRLALENDEFIYSAAEILAICRAASVPMVFDAHHHVCHEKLDTYDHPSVYHFVEAARQTWPRPEWQMAHISNGRDFFTDRRHSDLITQMPDAYRAVPWIEVEAKHKEVAIRHLQEEWLPTL